MARSARFGTTPARLRALLALLLLALVLPTLVLLWQTQRQLRWESLHQHRVLAEELARRIDLELQRLVAAEEARSEGDYRYLTLASGSQLVQRSPLAQWPPTGAFPGLVGHFTIAADGTFGTPLLPDAALDPQAAGLDAVQAEERRQRASEMAGILGKNRVLAPQRALADKLAAADERAGSLAAASSADSASDLDAEYPAQAGFDRLASARGDAAGGSRSNELGRLDELKLGRAYAESGKKDAALEQQLSNALARGKRKEQGAELEQTASTSQAPARVRLFESEVDPFEFALLDDGHGVLFRRVWRDGQRSIQGLLFAQPALLDAAIAAPFRDSALWAMSDLTVAWHDAVLQLVPGERASRSFSRASEVRGELLLQTRLSAPLDGLQLVFSARRLPAGPGARIVWWSGALLLALLFGGFWLLYRLGLRQIRLARQQQDFVSAVSHELKTPLTSIRMYAEMLREGWAGEDKRRDYYDYIFGESERLSRLIANVLQLARLERNEQPLELKAMRVDGLTDLVRSKVDSLIARAGFEVEYRVDAGVAEREVRVDADALCQVLINLVDNAIKFSAVAPLRRVEISARGEGERLLLGVRDFGFGIPKPQLRRIFALFYRGGDELTRTTVGTGIGLALVRQLARAMGGEVDVVNREPGAEFQLRLPFASR